MGNQAGIIITQGINHILRLKKKKNVLGRGGDLNAQPGRQSCYYTTATQ